MVDEVSESRAEATEAPAPEAPRSLRPRPPRDPRVEWAVALAMMVGLAFVGWAFVSFLR